MPKLHEITKGVLVFHCPGCGYDHPFHVAGSFHPRNQIWQWNGSYERPTFTPSLMVFKSDPAHRCHSFVKDGNIQFLSDCWHSLANKTVELPEYD